MRAEKPKYRKNLGSVIALGGGYALLQEKETGRSFLKIDDCKKFEIKKNGDKTLVIVEIPEDFLRWL